MEKREDKTFCQHGLQHILNVLISASSGPHFLVAPFCVLRGLRVVFSFPCWVHEAACLHKISCGERRAGRPGSLKAKPVRSHWPTGAGDAAPRGMIGSPAPFVPIHLLTRPRNTFLRSSRESKSLEVSLRSRGAFQDRLRTRIRIRLNRTNAYAQGYNPHGGKKATPRSRI